MWVGSLGWEDPLEKGMAPHSSILAWRTPWTEEPGGLQSMGSQRAGRDRETKQQTGTANAPRPPSLRMLALDPGKGGAEGEPVELIREHSQGPVPHSCPPHLCELVWNVVWCMSGCKGARKIGFQLCRL